MKKNILIIDDDKSILSIFEFILNKKYYNCIVTENREDAFKKIKKINIDLMFIDIRLKNSSGIDLFREIKKERLKTPVVLMTGHKTKELVSEMYEAGSNLIVYKPFDVEEILKLIEVTI